MDANVKGTAHSNEPKECAAPPAFTELDSVSAYCFGSLSSHQHLSWPQQSAACWPRQPRHKVSNWIMNVVEHLAAEKARNILQGAGGDRTQSVKR